MLTILTCFTLPSTREEAALCRSLIATVPDQFRLECLMLTFAPPTSFESHFRRDTGTKCEAPLLASSQITWTYNWPCLRLHSALGIDFFVPVMSKCRARRHLKLARIPMLYNWLLFVAIKFKRHQGSCYNI